jgi:filamentous hemagglutinin
MNKHCYRIIFNRQRGMLMVVSDIAKSYGGTASDQSTGTTVPKSRLATLRPLSFATLLALGTVLAVNPAQAKIVADANAPGNQQPQISQTANGTPQINIQTPSAGGVSRNQYSQFDVDQKGVILNNSRNNTNTQLGGYIAGNNNLAGGEARIILNEVNSRNPSQLNGFIEVAGKKAQVVIANASGITCDGCGFINADRATLTTGKAIIENGHLKGYNVQQGKIKVTGKGMDTSRQDYTDLIARSVEVNAGMWGNDVRVVTGRNEVSADLAAVKAFADSNENKPQLAIDVSELGGMYAGKIHLIGTEKGVGVYNAGKLGAQAGSVVISADGRIENRGKINAANDIKLATTEHITNSGTIYAGRNADLQAKKVTNKGTLATKENLSIKAKQVETTAGSLTAAGLNDSGRLQGTGVLQIKAENAEISGNMLASNNLFIDSDILTVTASGEIAANSTYLTSRHTLTNYGLIDGALTRIEAAELNNLGTGRIYGNVLAIQAVTLNNLAQNDVGATLGARSHMSLAIGTLNNRDHSLIYSGGSLAIGGQLEETHGVIGRGGIINNHSSIIEADGDMQITIGTLNNINDNFVTDIREVSRKNHHEFRAAGSPNVWDVSDVSFYHDQVKHINTPDANGKDEFYEYRYERVIEETIIIETDPAKLLSGGNLLIDADTVLNDKSQIVAGQTLQIIANTINNIEVLGERHITDIGTVAHWYRIHKKHSDSQGYSATGYSPATVIQQIVLKPSTLEENTLINGSGADIAVTDNNDRVTLPDSGLYQINPDVNGQYLIESDPRFTDYRQWLGSDYMIALMKKDPNSVMKRLGDGYYEQKLIREQIINLTGNRYLDGFASDEEQYKSLMTAGVEFAGKYELTLGVALTAEQMQNLTSDIVWMVSKNVTLKDGSTQTVLVPQVYAKASGATVNGSGALISGQQTGLQLSGDLNNSGRIVSNESLTVVAHNINNNGGQIAANDVQLIARNDINNAGGHIQGGNSVLLKAENDINISSTTRDNSNDSSSNTTIFGTGAVTVSNDNASLTLAAGNDINLKAAYVGNQGKTINDNSPENPDNGHSTETKSSKTREDNDGNKSSQIQLIAGNNINLTTVKTSQSESVAFDADNHYTLSGTQDIGTVISGGGDIMLSAKNNVNAAAANVEAADKLNVTAGNNLNILAGTSTASLDEHSKSKGTSGGIASQTTTRHSVVEDQYAESSSFSGNAVHLSAGNDMRIHGSQVIGTSDVNLQAGGNLTVEAAEENRYSQTQTTTQKSGLMSSGGLGFTVGVMKEDMKQTDTEKSYLGSMVGSTEGNVNIQAGKDITLKGSDVVAGQDIAMKGENINIESLDATTHYNEQYKMQKSGLTIAITGTAADIYDAVQAVKRAKESGNDKMLALQSIKAGLTATQAVQEMQLQNDKSQSQASIGISIMGGTQITEREINQEQHNVVGSGISAGNNITLIATGDNQGNGGDITIKGSEVKAKNDITLEANRDLNLIAALNTQHSDSDEKSYGGNFGIGFAIGGDESGLRFKGNANFSRERENADGSAWSEAIAEAGNKLTLKTGNDANLIGGQLKGDRVEANIGNNLNIQSLQDTDNYDYEKISGSIDASGGIGGFSGNVSLSATEMESHWASVTDQAGIFAGKGGYDIYVENNTDLKGAVIASDADDKSNNKLDTGTISFSDIENKADFDVSHVSVSVGTSGGGGNPTSGSMGPITAYHDSDSASSTTKSAVEQGELIIRDTENQQQDINQLSRDTENANDVLGQIFDKQKHLDNIEIIETVNEIRQQAETVMNNQTRLEIQQQALKDDPTLSGKALNDEIDRRFAEQNTTGMGGSMTKALDSVTSIISGALTGNITGGLAGAAAPHIASELKKLEESDPVAHKIAHGILGAVVAELQGGSGLAGGMGAASSEVIVGLIHEQLYPGVPKDELTEKQKETLSMLASLAGGMAGAITGSDNAADIGSAINAGKNAVENNTLGNGDTEMVDMMVCQLTGLSTACDRANPTAEQYAKGALVTAGSLSAGILAAATTEGALIGGTIGAGSNAGIQYAVTGEVNLTDTAIAGGVGFITGGVGSGLWGTVGWNAAGGAGSSYIKGDNPLEGGIISGIGSSVGYGAGKLIQGSIGSQLNPNWKNWTFTDPNYGILGLSKPLPQSNLPSIIGNVGDSLSSELITDELNKLPAKGQKNESK